MKCLLVSPSDSEEEVSCKLQLLFEKPVKLLQCTKSGDLFVGEGLNGEQLLSMIGKGYLYVQAESSSIPLASVKPQTSESYPLPPPRLVNPKDDISPSKENNGKFLVMSQGLELSLQYKVITRICVYLYIIVCMHMFCNVFIGCV